MKRSPITRRKPLRKTRLSTASKEQRSWNAKYAQKHRHDEPYQKCAKCGRWNHKDFLSRHHPFGRSRENILKYLYLCEREEFKSCGWHTWVHAHGTEARMRGWLQPEYDAKPHDPNWPIPWPQGALK